MSKKNIQMQVLGESGYDEIYPVPAGHASSHAKGKSDAIAPADIGAMDLDIYVKDLIITANLDIIYLINQKI